MLRFPFYRRRARPGPDGTLFTSANGVLYSVRLK
jgi:hypothetical protein